jgi:hypothetical protein
MRAEGDISGLKRTRRTVITEKAGSRIVQIMVGRRANRLQRTRIMKMDNFSRNMKGELLNGLWIWRQKMQI